MIKNSIILNFIFSIICMEMAAEIARGWHYVISRPSITKKAETRKVSAFLVYVRALLDHVPRVSLRGNCNLQRNRIVALQLILFTASLLFSHAGDLFETRII